MSGDDRIERWMEDDFEEAWRSLAEEAEDSNWERPEPIAQMPVEDDSREKPLPLAVVEQDLPDGLFGFTRRDSSHVVVSRNLYRVDRERTVRHEKTHHRFPDDEMTVRYINGDPDVRHTLSFNGNNPARLGRGSSGVPGTVAAYGQRNDRRHSYRPERADGYI